MKEPKNEGTAGPAPKLGNVIEIDEGKVQAHLDTMVRSTVEETLNAFLDAEAERLCRAGRYERSAERQDTRAGHYQRGLHTKAGPVELKVPKLRTLPFETAIIGRRPLNRLLPGTWGSVESRRHEATTTVHGGGASGSPGAV